MSCTCNLGIKRIINTVKAFILAGLRFGGFEIWSYLAGIYFGIKKIIQNSNLTMISILAYYCSQFFTIIYLVGPLFFLVATSIAISSLLTTLWYRKQ